MYRIFLFVFLPFRESKDHFIKFFNLCLITLNIIKSIKIVLIILRSESIDSFGWWWFIFKLTILVFFITLCVNSGARFCKFKELIETLYFWDDRLWIRLRDNKEWYLNDGLFFWAYFKEVIKVYGRDWTGWEFIFIWLDHFVSIRMNSIYYFLFFFDFSLFLFLYCKIKYFFIEDNYQ